MMPVEHREKKKSMKIPTTWPDTHVEYVSYVPS
jgi:hypothetical protein